MTTDATESLLRDALAARVGDAGTGTGPDPWLRVSRAHRRSRRRRRTVAAGALAVVAIATGSLVSAQPWNNLSRTTQPADGDSGRDFGLLHLDDGTPRGDLGDDAALRQAVVTQLQRQGAGSPNGPQLTRTDGVHVLWGGLLEGKRVALARIVQVVQGQSEPEDQEALTWMVGPAGGGTMTQLGLYTDGPAIQALPYLDQQGGRRLLAVVDRGAKVETTRTRISAHRSGLVRNWSPVQVVDGVVDLPVPDPAGQGPLLLRARVGSEPDGYASSANPFSPSTDSGPVNGLTPALRDQLAKQARGPGLPSYLTTTTLDSAIAQFWSDAAHTDPRVEWAGTVANQRGAGSLVVASAGFPDQGRVLVIQRLSKNQGDLWHYVGAVPADAPFGAASASSWRLAPATGSDPDQLPANQQVVVWMFGSDTSSVTVTVNGKSQRATTQDGLGWLLVNRGDDVRVTGHRSTVGQADILITPKLEPARSDWPLLGTG